MFASLSAYLQPTSPEPSLPEDAIAARTAASLAHVSDARRALDLLFNDRFQAAHALLLSATALSPFHALAHAFSAFTVALLGFEDEALEEALTRLMAAEALAGAAAKEARKSTRGTSVQATAGIEFDVIVADCDMMIAVLMFLKESVMDYAKAVWRLRRAYNAFEASYASLHAADAAKDPTRETFVASSTVKATEEAMAGAEKDRQRLAALVEAGVLFGRGLFALLLSVIPPKPAKALATFGYLGSRDTGLAHLRRCVVASSEDVHAPLAALALLTYHTSLSAFGCSEERAQDTIKECTELIKEMRARYPNGRLWRLFEGRVFKLRGDLDAALAVFSGEECSAALDNGTAANDGTATNDGDTPLSTTNTDNTGNDGALDEDFASPSLRHLIQLEQLMQYEYAWCLVLTESYAQAASIFQQLAENTNWSRAFYVYVQAACLFAANEHEPAISALQRIPELLQKKFAGRLIPAERYVERKCQQLIATPPLDDTAWPSAILELAYIWNAYRQLPRVRLQRACIAAEKLSTHARTIDEHVIANLLRGAAHRQLGENNTARKYLARVLELESDCLGDRHAMVYALVELAVISCEGAGKWDDAEALLKRAEDFSGPYDFDQRVNLRLSMLKEAVAEGRIRTNQPREKKR